MKHFFLIIISFFVFVIFLVSQETKIEPSFVSTAKYFDKTPPLRDMPIVIPGERDRSWKDGIIKNPSLESQPSDETRAKFADVIDPVTQEHMGTTATRGPIYSFDGVGNVNGVLPPDTEGDVGPNHYFQMINLSFAIYDKQGNKLYGPADNSTLWNGFIGPWTGTNDGDPILLYDEIADRWVATQFAINTSNGTYWELIAISETGDPLGSYYRYAFEFPAFNDYPKFGVWTDAYYASFNMFGSYTRAAVTAFEREKMLVGDPDAQMVYYDMPGTFSMMPSDLDGPLPPAGAPNYFAHLHTWGNQNLDIYEFHVDWENTSNSSYTLVASLETESFNPDMGGIPQPGTGQGLSSISDRLMYRLQYRNFDDYEVLLTNHTVKVDGHAGVRWYEMRKDDGDWYIYQQGTYSPDSEHRWMASIAMNGYGTIALGYTVSSSSTYPSVRYTGRSPDAPLGEMNYPEMELVAGTNSQSSYNRWGDYSMMSVDPVADSIFWYTQEYMGSGWRTRIGAFDFGPIMPPDIEVGNDTSICENSAIFINAQGTFIKSVFWTSTGDGFFLPSPPVYMYQGYLRGPGDIANGGFRLTVTALGYEVGMQDQDSVYVTIIRLPKAFAGNDTTICYNTSVMLNGEAINADYIAWSTNGDGVFDDITILNATYTPGQEDIQNELVELTLSAYPILPCDDEDTDKVKIMLDPCTGFSDPIAGKINIVVIPNPSTGRFTLKVDGLEHKSYEIMMVNQLGEIVLSRNGKGTALFYEEIDLPNLPKGVYFLKVFTNGENIVRKVLVQ